MRRPAAHGAPGSASPASIRIALGEGVHVARRDEHAAAAQQLRQRAGGGGDDRRAARRRLDGRQAEAFALGRQHQRQRAGVEVPQLVVGHESRPVHQPAVPCSAIAAPDRGAASLWNTSPSRGPTRTRCGAAAASRAAPARVRAHEHVHVLVRVEAADVDEPACARRQADARGGVPRSRSACRLGR